MEGESRDDDPHVTEAEVCRPHAEAFPTAADTVMLRTLTTQIPVGPGGDTCVIPSRIFVGGSPAPFVPALSRSSPSPPAPPDFPGAVLFLSEAPDFPSGILGTRIVLPFRYSPERKQTVQRLHYSEKFTYWTSYCLDLHSPPRLSSLLISGIPPRSVICLQYLPDTRVAFQLVITVHSSSNDISANRSFCDLIVKRTI